MSAKQNNFITEKNYVQMPRLYLNRILQYLKGNELQSHRENLPRKEYRKDALKFIAEYACMNGGIDLKEFIEELERTIIIKTLLKFNGNQKISAKFLRIKYTTLHEKIKRYEIHFRKEPVMSFHGTQIPGS